MEVCLFVCLLVCCLSVHLVGMCVRWLGGLIFSFAVQYLISILSLNRLIHCDFSFLLIFDLLLLEL